MMVAFLLCSCGQQKDENTQEHANNDDKESSLVFPYSFSDEEIMEFEDLKLNLTQKNLYIKGQEVILTKREFELLRFFLKYRNVVLSREQLAEEIWKEESFIQGRTIDVNITRLRKKIKPYDKNLITRQGYGYIFS